MPATKTDATLDQIEEAIAELRAIIDEWEPRLASAETRRHELGVKRQKLGQQRHDPHPGMVRLDEAEYRAELHAIDVELADVGREITAGDLALRGTDGFSGARAKYRRLAQLADQRREAQSIDACEVTLAEARNRETEVAAELVATHARRDSAIAERNATELAAAARRLEELHYDTLFARRTTLERELNLAEAQLAEAAKAEWDTSATLAAAAAHLDQANAEHAAASSATVVAAHTRRRWQERIDALTSSLAEARAAVSATR